MNSFIFKFFLLEDFCLEDFTRSREDKTIWSERPRYNNADNGEFSHAKDALDEFYALPSTVVRRHRSAEVSPPSPPTHKSRGEPFFPGGGGVTGHRPFTRSLHPTHSLQAPILCP